MATHDLDKNELDKFTDVLSPGRGKSKSQLTGNVRKIRDSAADLRSYVEKWDDLNVIGLDVLSELSNKKLKVVYDKENEGEDTSRIEIPEDVAPMCTKLSEIVGKMENVLKKFEKITSNMEGMVALEAYQNRDVDHVPPLFDTWPVEKFYETSKSILEMYQSEYRVKVAIIQNIAHLTDRDEVMVTLSTWEHQPLIQDTKLTVLVESILHETGIR